MMNLQCNSLQELKIRYRPQRTHNGKHLTILETMCSILQCCSNRHRIFSMKIISHLHIWFDEMYHQENKFRYNLNAKLKIWDKKNFPCDSNKVLRGRGKEKIHPFIQAAWYYQRLLVVTHSKCHFANRLTLIFENSAEP